MDVIEYELIFLSFGETKSMRCAFVHDNDELMTSKQVWTVKIIQGRCVDGWVSSGQVTVHNNLTKNIILKINSGLARQ